MHWLDPYIQEAKAALERGDQKSLTYAALEIRLGLERFCYERLRAAHQYISHEDLKSWTPKYVMSALLDLVDEHISSEYTFSISTEPAGEHHHSNEDFESYDYVPVGKQIGFDPKLITKLWQSMGSFVHTNLPKSQNSIIEHYSTTEKMKPKIEKALAELERLSSGTLIGTMVFERVSFLCECGQKNQRASNLLEDGMTVNCIKENCKNQYIARKSEEGFDFEPRVISCSCTCGYETSLPHRNVVELPLQTIVAYECHGCGKPVRLMWRLMRADAKPE